MSKPVVIVICGPTASGKTKLGIDLANAVDGEIISADSMQIYKDMNIGTATPTKEEQKQAIHHLISFVSPNKRYSVADYKNDATKKIEEILNKNKMPIIVGGTGLYINSLIYNIEFKEEKTDLEFRKKMEKLDVGELFKMAKSIDEEATNKISDKDKKRLIRIIEIYNSTGKTKTELESESRKKVKYDYKIYVLNMDRAQLYDRINKRVEKMLEEGLVDEVKTILKKYKQFPTAMQGLGYKEVVQYLNKEITYEEMVEKIKQESRRYAKRQLTWFRQYKDAIWIDANNKYDIENLIRQI